MSRRTAMEPCWTCGGADVGMILLDESHWLGTCHDCGECSSIHWSRPAARKLWNRDAKVFRAKRVYQQLKADERAVAQAIAEDLDRKILATIIVAEPKPETS